MRFSIGHATRYDYSVPVALTEHTVRLTPQGSNVHSLQQRLTVDPLPWTRTPVIDRYENQITSLHFSGEAQVLQIDSHCEVSVAAPPPFQNPGWNPLPWNSALGHPTPFSVAPNVRTFARHILAQSGNDAGAFLVALNQEIYRRTEQRGRVAGNARDAFDTLSRGTGACRDVTVLFLECCREVGIPGRFVSGYNWVPHTMGTLSDLHAWPEVQLPGLGWRGFDPSHGQIVADAHVPVCAAPSQSDTMPVQGGYTFRGTSVTCTLTTSVQVRKLDS